MPSSPPQHNNYHNSPHTVNCLTLQREMGEFTTTGQFSDLRCATTTTMNRHRTYPWAESSLIKLTTSSIQPTFASIHPPAHAVKIPPLPKINSGLGTVTTLLPYPRRSPLGELRCVIDDPLRVVVASAMLSRWDPIVEPGRAPRFGSVEVPRGRDEEGKTR